jgi:hypothetical protein
MRPFASRAQLTQYVERCVVLVFEVDVVLAVVEGVDELDLVADLLDPLADDLPDDLLDDFPELECPEEPCPPDPGNASACDPARARNTANAGVMIANRLM